MAKPAPTCFPFALALEEVLTDRDATIDSREVNSDSLSNDLVPDIGRKVARVQELPFHLAVTVDEPASGSVTAPVLKVMTKLHLVLELGALSSLGAPLSCWVAVFTPVPPLTNISEEVSAYGGIPRA